MTEHTLLHTGSKVSAALLPEWIQTGPMITKEKDCLSEFNTSGTAYIDPYTALAVLELANGTDSDICVVHIGPETYASEWKRPDGKTIIAYANKNGSLSGALVNGKRFTTLPPVGSPSDDLDLRSIMALYIAMCMENETTPEGYAAADCFDAVRQARKVGSTPDIRAIFRLCDFVRSGLESGKLNATVSNGSIELLTKRRVESGSCAGEVIFGTSNVLCPKKDEPAAVSAHTVGDAKRQFQTYADSRKWTPEQEMRIPQYPDDYYVPDEVLEMCQCYLDGRGTKLPVSNLCWRGITGCGKSTGVALMACVLHMPLYIMTCSTNTETDYFLSAMLPVTSKMKNTALPSIEDIWIDPEWSYEALTGSHLDGATSQQCLEKYGEACSREDARSAGYHLVNSEFIKGLECGAIVEIQEVSRIRDSGVAVGLNEYDHPGALIPLVDGTFAYRHPDALVVWTDNSGYNSCRSIDPSVLRRMSLIIDTFELDKEKVIDRAMYNTDNALPRATMTALYEVWDAVRSYCDKEDITEGDLSPSDLEHWAARLAKCGLGSARDTVRKYIVSKMTTDRETQERIMDSAVSIALDKYVSPLLT